jgi:hypothetical protein
MIVQQCQTTDFELKQSGISLICRLDSFEAGNKEGMV